MFEGKASARTRRKLLALLGEEDPPTHLNQTSITASSSAKPVTVGNGRSLEPDAPAATLPYTPLNGDRKEIRLLTILPCESQSDDAFLRFHSALSCTLEIVSLLDQPVYEALSYCWGDASDTDKITLNGVTVYITQSLISALLRFRHDAGEGAPLRLWVDAICINQKDVSERNKQVSLMRDIYSRATSVRIWLGPRREFFEYNDEMANAFQILRLVGTKGKTAPDNIAKWFVKPILGLGKMFQNPYWKRRWVTQEVALANRLTVHHGPLNIPLTVEKEILSIQTLGKKLIDDYASAQTRLMPIFTAASPAQPSPDEPTWQEWVKMFERTRTMLSAITPIVTARGMVKSGHTSPTLHLLRGAECSREHDHVYGLLGMVNREWNIVPDYERPWEEAFADFTCKVMQGMKKLNLLYHAPSKVKGLASWSLDWRVELGYNDHPVGLDNLYYAGAGSPFSLVSEQPQVIVLQGLIADTVQALGASTQQDESWIPTTEEMFEVLATPGRLGVLRSWMRLHAQHNRDSTQGNGIELGLLRTLFADNDNLEPVDVGGRVTNLPRRLTDRERRRYKAQIDRFLETGDSVHQTCFNLVNRMKKYAFFMTKDGRAGMSRPGVREGDRIYVFSGCDVPYCLREEKKDGRVVQRLISACYVDGIMDGEAVLSAMAVAETCGGNPGIEAVFEDVTLV